MTILHQDLAPSEAAMAPFLTEREFYSNADTFWLQIEEAILSASESNNGITPFTYAFVPGIYQFLTVGGGEIFTPDILQDFIDKLSSSAREKLNLQHVSTPQLRLYIKGCSRTLVRDDVEAGWHYIFCLTPPARRRSMQVRIAGQAVQSGKAPLLTLQRVIRFQLEFNQLLITNNEYPYSIETGSSSMNPLEGTLFLDGYIW
jgi:hypothetical protein